MTSRATMIWIVSVAAATGTAACTLDSPTYINSQTPSFTEQDGGAASSGNGSSGGATGSTGGAVTCSAADFVKPDLTKLTACGNGKGHCFAKGKLSLANMLTACPNAAEVCVPDEILQAGGQPLKSCTSIIGPGGCVTASLIPAIEQQGGGALKPDVCTGGQTCVPCTDPTHNGAPTPFCQPIGVHEKECSAASAGGAADGGAAPAALPACCTTNGKSNGVCIQDSAIPAAQKDQTKQDTCTSGNKCVPAAFVAGKPVTCTAGLLGSGVCMDKCFNDMMSFAGGIGILSSAGCGTTEVCVPCSLVSGQGVPGCK
jgi:hypothetical protein